MDSLVEKLCHIQNKLVAQKNQVNTFGNYKYRSCEDILESLKPLLKETGTILVIGDDLELIGDRYYIKATAVLSDGTENQIKATAYAREAESKKGMDAAQITGSSSSYARKYALNGLFCIDDTKDPDSRDNSSEETKEKKLDKDSADYYRTQILMMAQDMWTQDQFVLWRKQQGHENKLSDMGKDELADLYDKVIATKQERENTGA